jgi:hypothetical protein
MSTNNFLYKIQQQNEHSIQDMDLLLEKVKSANAIAR